MHCEHDYSTVQGSWSFIFSKMVQGQDQKGDAMIPGLELPNTSLVASTDLLPAQELLSSTPTARDHPITSQNQRTPLDRLG